MIKRTLGSIVLSGALLLGLGKNVQAQDFYYSTAINKSKVLVIEQSSGGFMFYRDRNNDSFADSKGTGFYDWNGVGRIVEEEDLPKKKYSFEDIETELLTRR